MINRSKLQDPRQWRKWDAAGALAVAEDFIQCPDCSHRLRQDALWKQAQHTEKHHPEIREERLLASD